MDIGDVPVEVMIAEVVIAEVDSIADSRGPLPCSGYWH
jgi:hypothetical protein